MAHSPAAFHVGDRVKVSSGLRSTITAKQETPFGWRYRLTGSGTQWYAEHALALDVMQWRTNFQGNGEVSGHWTAMFDGHLWFGQYLVGRFDYPRFVAEDTQDLWDERRRSS